MNWQQLFHASTPEERSELAIAMLRHIEARRRRWVLYRGRLIRERRRAQLIHFINDRRQASHRRTKLLWIYGLTALTLASWSSIFFVHPSIAALAVIACDLLLISVWIIRPYLRWQPARA